ncbi:MAG: Gfo/Idh/MocA family protein [Caulobacteraceae bacterium]
MAERAIRIGLLGAGAMGAAHAAAWADIADVEVAGVFSRRSERANAVAAVCAAKAVTDADLLLDDPSVEAVDICTPTESHFEYALAALAAGKHVFCETPLTLSFSEGKRLRDAARSACRLLQVGLLMRSIAPYEHVKAQVESRRNGRLVSLSTWRLGSYLRADAPDHKAHYGDPASELMTFDFDFAGWLLGRPASLTATSGRLADMAGPVEIAAILSFSGGAFASVEASGVMPAGHPFTVGFRALFEDALFELRNVFSGLAEPESHFTVSRGTASPVDVGIAGRDPYAAELRRFADCIAERADPALLDVERALEAQSLVEATRRSLETRRTVEVEPLD